jgi:hypothetical protein
MRKTAVRVDETERRNDLLRRIRTGTVHASLTATNLTQQPIIPLRTGTRGTVTNPTQTQAQETIMQRANMMTPSHHQTAALSPSGRKKADDAHVAHPRKLCVIDFPSSCALCFF